MTAVITRPSPDTDAFTRALTSRPLPSPISPTILIAEEDDDVRDTIEYKLQVAGFRTLTANNARATLTIAADRRPRVIILDECMPCLDGPSICHELHTRPATAEIPILMISGSGRADHGVPADDELTTPCSQGEVLHRLSGLLLPGAR
jgi:DNA-binding response OmpR family regulator